MSVTLEQLRDHAAAHPDHVFPMMDMSRCLGARTAGQRMEGFKYFVDRTTAPEPFDAFLLSLVNLDTRPFHDDKINTGWTDEELDDPKRREELLQYRNLWSGSQLVTAMNKMIEGASGLDAADMLTRNSHAPEPVPVPATGD